MIKREANSMKALVIDAFPPPSFLKMQRVRSCETMDFTTLRQKLEKLGYQVSEFATRAEAKNILLGRFRARQSALVVL